MAARRAQPIKSTMLFHKAKATADPGRRPVLESPFPFEEDQRLDPVQTREHRSASGPLAQVFSAVRPQSQHQEDATPEPSRVPVLALQLKKMWHRAPFAVRCLVGVVFLSLGAVALVVPSSSPEPVVALKVGDSAGTASIEPSFTPTVVPQKRRRPRVALSQDLDLGITSDPPKAWVKINAKEVGKTPVRVSMKSGSLVHVEVSRKGFEPHIDIVRLPQDSREFSVHVRLRVVDYGTLSLESNPVASVYVDGKPLNQETPVEKLQLKIGVHKVRLVTQSPTLVSEFEVEISAGAMVRRHVEFRK